WPSIQSYAVDRMRVDATILFILLSCAGIPGFAAVSWIMGLIGDTHGLRPSFFVVPCCLAALALLILLEHRRTPASAHPALQRDIPPDSPAESPATDKAAGYSIGSRFVSPSCLGGFVVVFESARSHIPAGALVPLCGQD